MASVTEAARAQRPGAGVGAEEAPEDARLVEARHAPPVDGAGTADEGCGGAVGEEAVVVDPRLARHIGTQAARGGVRVPAGPTAADAVRHRPRLLLLCT